MKSVLVVYYKNPKALTISIIDEDGSSVMLDVDEVKEVDHLELDDYVEGAPAKQTKPL